LLAIGRRTAALIITTPGIQQYMTISTHGFGPRHRAITGMPPCHLSRQWLPTRPCTRRLPHVPDLQDVWSLACVTSSTLSHTHTCTPVSVCVKAEGDDIHHRSLNNLSLFTSKCTARLVCIHLSGAHVQAVSRSFLIQQARACASPSPVLQSQPSTYKFISSPFNLLHLNNNVRLYTKTEPLLRHSTTPLPTLYHSKHPPCAPALPPPCFPSLSPLRRSPSWPPPPWRLHRWSLRATACVPTPRCRMPPRAA